MPDEQGVTPFRKMDRQLQIAYEGEIHDQAVLAHRAYVRIRTAIKLHRTPEAERQPPFPDQELVAVLHESVIGFLDACAIISKLFNPAPRDRSSPEAERALERGQQLRRSEEVDLQVDVFMSRAVRNAMEHIDEKMDEWLDGNTPYFKHTWVVIGRAPAWRAVSNAVCECSTRRRWRSRVLGEPTNIERMYEELVHLDQHLDSTTTDLHVRFAEPGQAGDSVSIRQATDKRSLGGGDSQSQPPAGARGPP